MNVTQGLVPKATTLRSTGVDPTPQPQGQLSIDKRSDRPSLPRRLETFQRVDSAFRDVSLRNKHNHTLGLRHVWNWALLRFSPVPHEAYAQLLAENNALREDNDRLREALAQANYQGASSQKSVETMSEEIGLIVRELIDPLLKKCNEGDC